MVGKSKVKTRRAEGRCGGWGGCGWQWGGGREGQRRSPCEAGEEDRLGRGGFVIEQVGLDQFKLLGQELGTEAHCPGLSKEVHSSSSPIIFNNTPMCRVATLPAPAEMPSQPACGEGWPCA